VGKLKPADRIRSTSYVWHGAHCTVVEYDGNQETRRFVIYDAPDASQWGEVLARHALMVAPNAGRNGR